MEAKIRYSRKIYYLKKQYFIVIKIDFNKSIKMSFYINMKRFSVKKLKIYNKDSSSTFKGLVILYTCKKNLIHKLKKQYINI